MILALLIATAQAASPCEAALTTATDRYEAWRCFYMAARKVGSWDEAEARIARGVADGDPWAQIVLGHVYSDQGDARAEAHYREAIAAFERREQRAGAAQARFGLANFLWHHGAGAEPPRVLLDAALADAEAYGDPLLAATARAQIARHLWRTAEDYGRAYTLARAAERDAFPGGTYQLQLLVLHVLAGVCGETGRMEEGVATKARLVELAAAAGDTYVEATARLNLADAWLVAPWLAPPGGAAAEAERALDAAQRAKNPYSVAGARCVLARARGPDVPTAVVDWAACADGYAALGEAQTEVYGRMGLAVASRRGDPLGADALVEATVARADALGIRVRALDARFVSTELSWERGETETALGRSDTLLDALETLRDRQRTEADRAGLGAHGAAAYDARASHLLDAGDVDGALATIERLRGRLLIEWLEAGRIGAPRGGEAEAARREQIAAIEAAQASLVAASTDAERTERRASLEVLERAEQEARDAWLRADASLYPQVEAPPPSVATLQGLLGADEALVVYQIATPQTLYPPYAARSWALVVTASSRAVAPLGDLDGLDSRVRLFEGLVARRDGSSAPAGRALAEDLLGPVRAALPPGIRRVVLVPDGALHHLPLAALDPTADLRAVSTVPSLRTWLALRRQAAPRGARGVLALADTSLPRAGAEAQAVVARLGGDVRLGADANAEALLAADLSAYRVLHVAAHVTVDEARPERSAIHLATGAPGTQPGGDGSLRPRDIVGLPLDGQLVVLSACGGAAGRAVEGEGVMGMARAFLQSGARAVVASVWPLEDAEAERVFTLYADALARGETVDEALRSAQIEARNAGLPEAAWAGLLVVGDGGWAPFPGGTAAVPPWAVRLGAALGVLAAAGFATWWRFVRRR
ncbi:MAG: CHAT domain-containing protein [Pseudomonadota bacterium]|nr:CHAT domain-containing protein [Pseudomonadota bacterium]